MKSKVKKILSLGFIMTVCTIGISVDAFEVKRGDTVGKIVDLSNTKTNFGVLKQVSYVTEKKDKVQYHSSWASWQPDIMISLDHTTYDLYEHSKYVDFMVFEYEKFRIEANEERSKTFSYTEQKTIAQSTATSESINTLSAYETQISSNINAIIDGLTLNLEANSNFKVTNEYNKTLTLTNERRYTNTIQTSYTEFYSNKRDTYAYVRRGFRQKYKIMVGVEYLHLYDVKRTGSGLWGLDSNYSYSFRDFSCTSVDIYLTPVEAPYYDISYYIDDSNGNMIFANQTNNSIIFF